MKPLKACLNAPKTQQFRNSSQTIYGPAEEDHPVQKTES